MLIRNASLLKPTKCHVDILENYAFKFTKSRIFHTWNVVSNFVKIHSKMHHHSRMKKSRGSMPPDPHSIGVYKRFRLWHVPGSDVFWMKPGRLVCPTYSHSGMLIRVIVLKVRLTLIQTIILYLSAVFFYFAVHWILFHDFVWSILFLLLFFKVIMFY